MMENIIIILILLVIVSCIMGYLVRAKKRGQTCVGCPYTKQCAQNKNSCCEHNSKALKNE